MYAMNDPRYKYRPLSADRKASLSRAHLSRLGVPEGHRLVYGVHVPEEHVEDIRDRATTIARKKDYAAAQQFTERARDRSWKVRQAWTERDLAQLSERWRRGETGARIAKALGRSRSAILGKVSRLGLRRAPAGFSEVPVAMIQPMIAASLDIPAPDHLNREFRTAMILVSPMFVAGVPYEMARWTGYPAEECSHVIYTMTTNGIWKAGNPNLDRYMQGNGKPGLQEGDVLLVLDVLLCLGDIRCSYGGEAWFKPELMR